MSQVNTNSIYDASGGSAAKLYGVSMRNGGTAWVNRIINGGMVIDQRNNGASVTPTNSQYLVDRFYAGLTQASKFTAQQNAGAVTPPAGFKNYLGVTSSSAYSVLTGDTFYVGQVIEGYNIADLGWGAAGAQTVTLSFWVRSSLTGTFGGTITNASARSYLFSYTISAANTWEQKTVTIAGDTSGTWGSTNAAGIIVWFGLGSGSTFSGTAGVWSSSVLVQPTGSTSVVGTNGATWYITGVQLEAGTVASPFERIDYGRQLIMCQRYLPVVKAGSAMSGYAISATTAYGSAPFGVIARVAPTGLTTTISGALWNASGSSLGLTSLGFSSAGTAGAFVLPGTSSGLTGGAGTIFLNNSDILFTGCEL